MLRNDGTVPGYNFGVPAGRSNVVAISASIDQALALRSDGTLISWSMTLPSGLANVSAMAAGKSFNLLITTNPPPPVLAAAQASGGINVSTPVAVSGYVLEGSPDPKQPFTVIETFTNAAALGSSLNVPTNGTKQYLG